MGPADDRHPTLAGNALLDEVASRVPDIGNRGLPITEIVMVEKGIPVAGGTAIFRLNRDIAASRENCASQSRQRRRIGAGSRRKRLPP